MGPCLQRHEGPLEVETCRSTVAKQLAAAVSAVPAAERDALLATKLHVPGSFPSSPSTDTG